MRRTVPRPRFAPPETKSSCRRSVRNTGDANFARENYAVRAPGAIPRRPLQSRRRSPRDSFSLPQPRRILPPIPMKKSPATRIEISVRKQRLTLKARRKKLAEYPVSPSRYGLGSKEGSFKTPSGRFRVADKIGEGAPIGTIFKSRKPVKATKKRSEERRVGK